MIKEQQIVSELLIIGYTVSFLPKCCIQGILFLASARSLRFKVKKLFLNEKAAKGKIP
ncbi:MULTISPECIES: hypothetical protein [Bacillus]|uniref:hypothetical protein n=1 Tax=Bacillus TaxID=1386 RepID=UPI001E2A7B75|nr:MULTISPECIES: hypothetical protein [Bacillus]MCC2928881.1 hypothetical protein [Bacillus sp. LBG-1-113]MCY8104488.1 hypothetical protein [Bacillus mojavensis]MCY8480662.1 hypothetical protein [Bacillus mojavensis]MCY9190547.1 hypothetical protein [Bacillus mojavensis]MEC1686604.1 hypothetical protein [Bacillus mojavensis]